MKEKLSKIGKKFLQMNFIVFKFIVVLALLFSSYMALNKAFRIHHEIQESKKVLFAKFEPRINVAKYPKTYSEYIKINKKDDLAFGEGLNKGWYNKVRKENYLQIKKDSIRKLKANQFTHKIIQSRLRDFVNNNRYAQLYYDQSGKLIYIQVFKDNSTLEILRYDSKGNFIGAELESGTDVQNYIFNRNKDIEYNCSNNDCSNFTGIYKVLWFISLWLQMFVYAVVGLFCLVSVFTIPSFIIIQALTFKDKT